MAKFDNKKLQAKIDNICRYIFLTPDGKPKSASLLYSFVLSILFTAIYFIVYWFIIDWIEILLPNASIFLKNILMYLIPAIIGTIPCVLTFFLFRKHRDYTPLAYNWMLFFLISFSLIALLWCIAEGDFLQDASFFFVILGLPALLSVGIGFTASHILFHAYEKKQQAAEKAKKRPAYYNT